MHAEDDRYAKIFLFTEEEVEILCNTHADGRVRAMLAYPLLSKSLSLVKY